MSSGDVNNIYLSFHVLHPGQEGVEGRRFVHKKSSRMICGHAMLIEPSGEVKDMQIVFTSSLGHMDKIWVYWECDWRYIDLESSEFEESRTSDVEDLAGDAE